MKPSHPSPSAQQIKRQLEQTLQPSWLEVIDESQRHAGHPGANGSGFGSHFRVRISSPLFVGKTALARHRLVYDALQEFIQQGLHALAIEAGVPDAAPLQTPI